MREIKFRMWNNCKDKSGSSMFYDVEQVMNCLIQQMNHDNNNFGYNHVGDGNVFMQYTGLKDKNGKEVYEGDIIKWKETRFWNKEQEQKGVAMPRFFKSAVVYDDAEFLVSSTQEFDTPLCCFFTSEDIHNQFDYKAEVIGNIYENPELLNQ